MNLRHIALPAGLALFAAGCAALWASFNRTLFPQVSQLAAIIGGIMILAGTLIVAALFVLVLRSGQKQRRNREAIGRFLAECKALLGRARTAGKGTPFDDEVQAWANGVAEYIEKELGPSYVQLLQHDDRAWRYASGAGASEVTPFLERTNARLGEYLKMLS